MGCARPSESSARTFQYTELREEEYGYFLAMAGCQLGQLPAESFCERTISVANLLLNDKNTELSPDMVEKCVVLRMNRKYMAAKAAQKAARSRF